jgi:ribosomal protein L36
MTNKFDSLINIAGGTLSQASCQQLFDLAKAVPEDGVIFDVYAGEGRSTIALALGLEDGEHVQARIVTIDTHVTNPMSTTPHEDGTILKFLGHLRRFRVAHRVYTMVAPDNALTIFNKRSANLIVLQAPTCQVSIDNVFDKTIDTAKEIIRRNGRIAVACPPGVSTQDFFRFVDCRFVIGFRALATGGDLLVYEETK